jgi:hypothetical protein
VCNANNKQQSLHTRAHSPSLVTTSIPGSCSAGILAILASSESTRALDLLNPGLSHRWTLVTTASEESCVDILTSLEATKNPIRELLSTCGSTPSARRMRTGKLDAREGAKGGGSPLGFAPRFADGGSIDRSSSWDVHSYATSSHPSPLWLQVHPSVTHLSGEL